MDVLSELHILNGLNTIFGGLQVLVKGLIHGGVGCCEVDRIGSERLPDAYHCSRTDTNNYENYRNN
eukprot:m.64747 g.64747  ORF g.64747 m.64747 type:complete len:66 (+) comp9729_c0_seq2:143-340(+)